MSVPRYIGDEIAAVGDRITSAGARVIVLEVGPFVPEWGAPDLRVAMGAGPRYDGPLIASPSGVYNWHARACELIERGEFPADVVTDKDEIRKLLGVSS